MGQYGDRMEERTSTYLATSFTHVWLFARVDTRVYRQGGALDKLLPTAWPITSMRPNAGVDSFWEQVRYKMSMKTLLRYVP